MNKKRTKENLKDVDQKSHTKLKSQDKLYDRQS